MISVELQSVRAQLPASNQSSASLSLTSAFFSPSASTSSFDPTSLAQTCFAFTRLCPLSSSASAASNPVIVNATKISLPPFADYPPSSIRFLQLVPENGNVISQRTRITIEFVCWNNGEEQKEKGTVDSVALFLTKIQYSCPWISSVMIATLRRFFCSTTTTMLSSSSTSSKKNGLVISGPPKSGKTSLANAVAISRFNVDAVEKNKSNCINSSNNVHVFDCSWFAELCVLHASSDQANFNPQIAIRNILNRWLLPFVSTSNSSSLAVSCLILEHLDFFDTEGSIRNGSLAASGSVVGQALPSSIPEALKRIFWLELAAAFRKASKMNALSSSSFSSSSGRYMWIATVSDESLLGLEKRQGETFSDVPLQRQNSGSDDLMAASSQSSNILSSSSVFAPWFNFSISIPETPEFSQRLAIFKKEVVIVGSSEENNRVTNDDDDDKDHGDDENEKPLLTVKQLVIQTHGWSIGELYERLFSANGSHTSKTMREVAEKIQQQQRHSNSNRNESPFVSAVPKVFGMDEDLKVIEDSCVRPLCRVASELKEGSRSFSSSSSSSPAKDIFLPKGILVVGPSGCGKSHLLRHLASKIVHGSSGGVSVIFQDTLSLVQKEVGVTERNIHNLFERARSCAPCVLLLDHIDSIASPRNSSTFSDSSSQVADRMLSTLLIEMDGVNKSERDRFVIVVATAPSLANLDVAVRRPGRLDIHVVVKFPGVNEVFEMLFDGLKPTFADLVLGLRGNEHEEQALATIKKTIQEKVVEEFFPEKVKGYEASSQKTKNVTYADVQSWYREKVSKLVSTWLLESGTNPAKPATTSFTSLEDWINWMNE